MPVKIDRPTFKRFQAMLHNVADSDFEDALARVHAELEKLGFGSKEISVGRGNPGGRNRQFIGGTDRSE